MVDVDITDEINIHADGMVMSVYAQDVVDSVRNSSFFGKIPLGGMVMPDGSVKFSGGLLDEDFTDPLD